MKPHSTSKICLIGYMASGKSRWGKALAQILTIPFVDLDQYIEVQEGKSIPEIFEEFGEDEFRKMEQKHLKKLLEKEGQLLIALGGGTPLLPANLNLIQEYSLSIYLQLPLDILIARLTQSSGKRPLLEMLKGQELKDFITKSFEERKGIYEQADISVDVRDFNPSKWNDFLPEIKSYLK